jgi:hypothetical protein
MVWALFRIPSIGLERGSQLLAQSVRCAACRTVPSGTLSGNGQAVLVLHRVRQGFVGARTALANQIRGLLAQFGLVVPQACHDILAKICNTTS